MSDAGHTLRVMKLYNFLSIWALLLIVTTVSCGQKVKNQADGNITIQLKPESTEVTGDMEGCFTVVDRSYKVKFEDFIGGVITIEIERTDAPLPFSTDGRELYSFSTYSASPYVQVGFGIELLDKDGDIISKTSPSGGGLSGPYSPDECVELVKLAKGKKGSIRFSINEDAKEAVSFRITSAFQYGGSNTRSSEESVTTIYEATGNTSSDEVEVIEIDEEANTSNGTKNWDSLLDSYEKFVNKYIAFYAKVKDGSVDITSPEYAEYMQEAANFADEIQNAKGTMSTKQLARYNKISAKLYSVIN